MKKRTYYNQWVWISLYMALLYAPQSDVHAQGISGQVDQATNTAIDSAARFNNIANLLLVQWEETGARLDTAITYYKRAIEKDHAEPGYKLNLGIAYLAMGDSVYSDYYFTEGISQCDTNLNMVYHLLKLEANGIDSVKGDPQKVTEDKIKKAIQKNTDLLKKRRITQDNVILPHRKPIYIRRAGPKSTLPETFSKYLYWKY